MGRLNSPYYRLVVADSRFPRDGRFIEVIGHYQPLRQETKLEINEERALHWLNVGAQPSDTVRSLLRKKGIMEKWHNLRVERKKSKTTAGQEQASGAQMGEPQPSVAQPSVAQPAAARGTSTAPPVV
jgi:small subunit ribosomal protein S16